jgi:hypothetical protein
VRFFTTAWYDRTQAADATPDVWHRAFKRYDAHLNRIRDRLPTTLRRFSNLTFHDCQVYQVLMRPDREVWLSLHGFRRDRNGKGLVNAVHEIALSEVTATNISPLHVGEYWLYEEVDVTRSGYRLSVLLNGRSVLWFEFATLLLKTIA